MLHEQVALCTLSTQHGPVEQCPAQQPARVSKVTKPQLSARAGQCKRRTRAGSPTPRPEKMLHRRTAVEMVALDTAPCHQVRLAKETGEKLSRRHCCVSVFYCKDTPACRPIEDGFARFLQTRSLLSRSRLGRRRGTSLSDAARQPAHQSSGANAGSRPCPRQPDAHPSRASLRSAPRSAPPRAQKPARPRPASASFCRSRPLPDRRGKLG